MFDAILNIRIFEFELCLLCSRALPAFLSFFLVEGFSFLACLLLTVN